MGPEAGSTWRAETDVVSGASGSRQVPCGVGAEGPEWGDLNVIADVFIEVL